MFVSAILVLAASGPRDQGARVQGPETHGPRGRPGRHRKPREDPGPKGPGMAQGCPGGTGGESPVGGEHREGGSREGTREGKAKGSVSPMLPPFVW